MTPEATVRLDAHVHTGASHDAEGTVREVLARAHNAAVDAVAVTDHDTTVAAREALELQEAYDVTVVPGVEVSTAAGHVLALGVRERPRVGRPLADTVAWIRRRGGLAVIPHPFQVSRHGVRKAAIDDCDGIEVFNAWAMTGIQNRRADAFATRRGYPKLAGSDAHDPATVGSAYTEVTVETSSPSVGELLRAVAAGRTRAFGQSTSTRRYVRRYTRAVRRRLRTGRRATGNVAR
jgi:predicted metal-dependent phosphoesterase TrpH